MATTAKRRKLYELTPAHRKQLKPWADKWIANALNTIPMDDADRDAMKAAVNGLHAAANLDPPERIVFCASPIGAAIAASVASGVHYLRDNPDQHVRLFRRPLSESDLRSAIAPAVAFVVRHGMHRAMTLDLLPSPEAKKTTKIDAATYAATSAATSDATRAATSAATSDATRDATVAATSAATRDATRDATSDATDAATYAATSAATRDATDAATSDATRAATYAATSDATRAATSAATSDATDA
ncbi:MAG TPA: hypothetical protein VFI42_16005, partial [Thermomicrobiaceae bacterium]|nr:hypothetical protein [Thermomicrobiaceae bacterium]